MYNLKQYGTIPISPAILAESLSEYKSPKDKISSLEGSGQLIRIKNGLYVVSNKVTNKNLSLELIANQIQGPSYISFESALWYYGLIPERVYVTKSASMQRGKSYNTPLGRFEYIKVAEPYFAIGLQHILVENEYAFLIAKPEKALCDLIISTAGLRLQSVRAMREYLFEDIRIDTDSLSGWDLNIIEDCIKFGYKKTEMRLLYKFLSCE